MNKQTTLAIFGLLSAFSAAAAERRFDANFEVAFDPPARVAHASIELLPAKGRIKELDLKMPAARYSKIEGDGTIARNGDRIVWNVPKTGGRLRYDVKIDHQRENGAYDARMTADWVIVRGDDLFPSATTRAIKDSESNSRLRIVLPAGWTDKESGYRIASDGRFIVVNLLAVLQTLAVTLVGTWVLRRAGATDSAEMVAHVVGVLVPVFSSYLMHRHWTFSRHQEG